MLGLTVCLPQTAHVHIHNFVCATDVFLKMRVICSFIHSFNKYALRTDMG